MEASWNRALLAAVALAAAPACSTQLVCAADQAAWQGQCLTLSSDPKNCGSPGYQCPAGENCSGGLCCQGTQCSPVFFAACYDTAEVRGATATLDLVGAPVAVDAGPISLAWSGTSLWVANSSSNTLDELSLGSSSPATSVTIPASGSYSDLEFLGAWQGLLYASNDAVGSIVVVDPSASPAIVGEIPLGPSTYPQGIAFSATTAYVALNGTDAVAVVDLPTRTVAKTISLSSLASPGARAMPARLALVGARLYVTLWNLNGSYAPGGNGRLAVIDTSTGALAAGTNPIDLGPGCLDPAGIALHAGKLYVTCGFFEYSSSTVTGNGIVAVDVSGDAPVVGSPVVTAGAAPGALAFCGDLAFVGDRLSGSVLRFDPVHGAVTAHGLVCAPRSGGASYVADVACGQ